jgi:hypothetical protein
VVIGLGVAHSLSRIAKEQLPRKNVNTLGIGHLVGNLNTVSDSVGNIASKTVLLKRIGQAYKKGLPGCLKKLNLF